MKNGLRYSLAIVILQLAAAVLPAAERLPIVASGEQRAQIKSLDILDRPNRPLHVYGNTVRRRASR
ncbi:MAG: hypothetical protein FJ295_10090 [Planctomycetes bacterium]|nr:hypothetical protein [Planctomycetota bacterium]